MSKECPGKYHGSAVKIINDDEKYCLACQQQIALKKQKKKETWGKVGGGLLAIAGMAATITIGIVKLLGGGKGDNSNS